MSKYTNWVITLPCCVSGDYASEHMGVDPHHAKGYSWITESAMAKKGSDLTCMPLRHDLHQELHQIGWESFEKKYNVNQLEMMALTLLQAEREGVLTINSITVNKL
jgi:hypothetical protein